MSTDLEKETPLWEGNANASSLLNLAEAKHHLQGENWDSIYPPRIIFDEATL